MATLTQSAIDYNALITHIQTLEIPIFDFVNHLQCTFHIEDVIGSGGAMTVYKALLRRESQGPIEVALKIPKQVVKETSRDRAISHMLAAVRQEIRMMKYFETHPYIVTLYGITFQDLKPILVMELAAASMNDYLVSKINAGARVKWETKARFCYEVAEGIRSFHSVNIVHGDIKADNILLFGNTAEEGNLVAKLSDFGYSSTIASIASGRGTGGTPNFLAPECTPFASPEMKLYADKPTKDNYAYGLYVWQVATDGEIPYEDMDVDQVDDAKHSDRQLLQLMKQLPEDTPESFKQIIIGMTQYMPNERENLMNVKAIMSIVGEIDLNKYTEAKEAFEVSIKNLPRDMGSVEFKSLQSMLIPPPIKRRLVSTYEVAASKGDAEAAYFLSVCYGSEFGVKLNMRKMISWAIQAAEGGNFEAVKRISSSYPSSIEQLPDNRTLLFPWILEIAKTGHKESQFFISQCYLNGICVEKDISKYEEWNAKLLNNNEPVSQQFQYSIFPEESALHCAAREGNIEAIKFFIQQEHMDVNTRNSSGITPLLLATIYHHIDVVNSLIVEFGADVNVRDNEGSIPLHFATRVGDVDIVKLLICKFGADVNAKNNDNVTPLHAAARYGHIDTVKLVVIEFGADVNAKSSDGWTSLHLAAQNGHVNLVKLLVVELRADINARNNSGSTPLHLAAFCGHIDILKLLMINPESNVNVKNNDGWAPLHYAAQNGHVDLVKLLIVKHGADVNVKNNNGWIPLHAAAYNGHTDTVKSLLINVKSDVNTKDNDGWTPLHFATQNGHADTVKLLVVELGANVNVSSNSGWTPLHSAVYYGHAHIAKSFVVETGSDVNLKSNDGWAPLHFAAQNGHTDIVKLFVVELGADVNISSGNGWTPLHSAAYYGHAGSVKFLVVEAGSDANIKGNDGQTPLHLAAQNGHVDTAKLLVVVSGADVNSNDNEGWTPLHLSVARGHINMVKLLAVELRANVNIKSSAGWTPLHSAARNGHVDTVKLLVIEVGADVNVKNNDELTPLHVAVDNGHVDIVKLLAVEFGANVNPKEKNGLTPLHSACNGHVEIVKLLIWKFGADINAKDCDGRTPLIHSIRQRCTEVIIVLLEHPRADIYVKTEDGKTLLHLAVETRQEIVVKMLVDRFHLDIHAKDSKGQTSLELANKPPVYYDVVCDGCRKYPVVGELLKCTVCVNFDFCDACYSAVNHYNQEHAFKKVVLPSVKHLLIP